MASLWVRLAVTRGATIGAISMPIAYVLIWPKTNVRNALIVVADATIIGGIVGVGFLGPNGPISLAASVAFWLAFIAIERARSRGHKDSGFGGYFS